LWNQRVNEEAWLRLNRSAAMGNIENLGGWLTTVIGRVCLDMLRSRKSRREESLDDRLPDLLLSRDGEIDPEHEMLIADSVGLALLIVLETLGPHERLAFVLHDMFAVSFEEDRFHRGLLSRCGKAAGEPRPAESEGRGPDSRR
jgi:RNA polymerase sigma-70 factor (ECF subfamily)